MPGRRFSSLERDVRTLEAALGPLPPPPGRPALVVLSGLPASGKSYLATRICRRYPLVRLESDALRKVLFRLPIYTQAESRRLFSAIHLLLERLLEQGQSALLDATNLKEAHREPLYQIAERSGARLLLVLVQAPHRLARARLNAKLRGGDPATHSEADIEVYEMMRREQEPMGRPHLIIDTSRNLAPDVDKIVSELERTSN